MGSYNPHVPIILGQELVPIRDEDLVFSPNVNTIEQGHGFATAAPHTLQDARMYIHQLPPAFIPGQVYFASIYAQGQEAATGPVQRTIIPCNFGAITGTGSISSGTFAQAVADPSDYNAITFGSGNVDMAAFFATNSYAALLNGRRILGVNLLYTLVADAFNAEDIALVPSFAPKVQIEDNLRQTNTNFGLMDVALALNVPKLGTIRFGEVAEFWSTTLSPNNTTERLPWNYATLQRFEATAGANRLYVFLTTNGLANLNMRLGYLALEVVHCVDTRLIVGGRSFGEDSSGFPKHLPYRFGANIIPMRTNQGYAANPSLAAGAYSLVVSSADLGDMQDATESGEVSALTYPSLNALRELYDIPPHPGIKINITTTEGDTFTDEATHILPHLSLHASGGPLIEPHVYGRQAAAQVYGSNTATQEIYDDLVGVDTVYPQVRFYARRFGEDSGTLTLTGTGSLSASSVAIASDDFDDLSEIIDGWREVTLRFVTPPTMGTLSSPDPSWMWQAPSAAAGTRWEILGASAPALSGIPGDLYNLVPSPHQLYTATYQPPAGSTVELTWMPQGVASPWVSGAAADQATDAVLIFAQDMLPVTGFTVVQASQPVSGIGFDCGDEPCCIPSAIFYNSLTWSLPINTGVAADVFDRSVAAGSWGNADVGGAYTLSGTAGDFAVGTSNPPWDTDDQGVITFSANSSDRFAVLNIGAIDFDVTTEIQFLSTIASGSLRGGVVGRYTDASNTYLASLDVSSTGAITLKIEKIVGGSVTTLASISMPNLSGGIGSTLVIRFTGYGTFLKAKAWAPGADEPDMWSLETTDSALTTGSFAGIFGRDESAVTGHIIAYDNLSVGPPRYWFGFYELQRQDSLTDWQTIMMATDPATVSFKDYEARVGVQSDYRIRAVDPYQFAGPWSSTVSETVDDPGIVIGCEGGHILIFTSNSEQDGSVNLAYSSVFERDVNEDFEFVEAQDVVLQKMYGKDFVTAFRPLERGGERFIRTVLVQAAAISPPTLGDFTSLRDMAWDSVPYICVRDEDGNRWFATVIVPSGRVQLNRTLYMASVTVQEVTDTAYPVDP